MIELSHVHSIYDTDNHFLIDPATRVITTLSDKLTLIQYDHNCERYTFEIPRIIEGHDMSECDKVEIHFDNVSKDKKTINHDFYTVTDLSVYDEDSSIVIFSWLISDSATQLVGKLRFSVHFECFDEEGKRIYGLNTAYFEKVTISSGISNTENLIVEHSDFVSRMELLAEQNKATIEGFATNYEQNVHYEEMVKEITDILTPLSENFQFATYQKETMIGEDNSNSESFLVDAIEQVLNFDLGIVDFGIYSNSYENMKVRFLFKIDAYNAVQGAPDSHNATLEFNAFTIDNSGRKRFSGVIRFSAGIENSYYVNAAGEKDSIIEKCIYGTPVDVTAYSDGTWGFRFLDADVFNVIYYGCLEAYGDGGIDDRHHITASLYMDEHITITELSDALDVLNGEVV